MAAGLRGAAAAAIAVAVAVEAPTADLEPKSGFGLKDDRRDVRRGGVGVRCGAGAGAGAVQAMGGGGLQESKASERFDSLHEAGGKQKGGNKPAATRVLSGFTHPVWTRS